MTVTERLLAELDAQGKTQAELCRYLDIKTSIIAGWKKQNKIPPSWHLVRISEFLNVSVDWLLTGEGKKFREDASPPWELKDYQKEVAEKEFQNLLESQVALLNAFEKLSPEDKVEVWAIIDLKLKKRNLSSNSLTSKDGSSGSKTA